MRSKVLMWLAVWLIVFEGTVLFGVNIVAYGIRESTFVLPDQYLYGGLFICALYLICGITQGCYSFHRAESERIHAMGALRCWGGTMVVFIVALYAFKISEDFSRFWLIEMIVGGGLILTIIRTMAVLWLARARRSRRLASRVAVLGSPGRVQELTELLLAQHASPDVFAGAFIGAGFQNELVQGVPKYGSEDSLHQMIAGGQVDEVLLCYEPAEEEAFRASLAALREQPVNVRLKLPSFLHGIPALGVTRTAGQAGLILADIPIGGWASVQKRCVDLALGSFLLLLLAPLMLALAAGVLVTMGRPIFFRQRRYGFNNDEFMMLKFRSMLVDEKAEEGTAAGDAVLRQVTRDDPRVTRFGHFLRSTSLDELPQLLNVLSGSMSLVGPRPHAVSHNRYYAGLIDGYLGRHRVKPGITGWAQVNGLRGETDTLDKMRHRVELDLHYIENWSLGFDLKILAMTVFEVLSGRSAY